MNNNSSAVPEKPIGVERKIAAIYVRVSTTRQEEEDTIESQIAAIKERAKSDGYIIEEKFIYKDEGYTGSLIERPALDRLREDSKLGLFERIYVYDFGRLSRDLSSLLLLIDELESNGMPLVSLFERITGEPYIDKLLLQIMGAVHEYERKKISQRFLNGKIQKAKRRLLVGYTPPYGYDYHPIVKKKSGTVNGRFTINKSEAMVVKQIFTWVAEGVSLREVIRRLHRQNVMPKKMKRKVWSKGPLSRLIANESYIGKHYFNKTEATVVQSPRIPNRYRRVTKSSRRARPREEWILFEIPRIIDEELFDKVQKIRIRNKKFSARNNHKNQYLLTGLTYCLCGSTRTGDPANNGHLYYRCTDRLKRFPEARTCYEASVNAKVLDAMVWKVLNRLLSNPRLISKQAERWLNSKRSYAGEAEVEQLNFKIRSLKDEERKYTKALGAGLSFEVYEEQLADIAARRNDLESRLKEIRSNTRDSMNLSVEQLVEGVQKLLRTLDFKDKKYIVRKLVDRIEASKDSAKIWGQIPVLATEDVGLGVKYRDRGATECRQVHLIQRADRR